MSGVPGVDPSLNNFGRLEVHLSDARRLGENMLADAAELSSASIRARDTNGLIKPDSYLYGEWPLIDEAAIQLILLNRVEPTISRVGLLAIDTPDIDTEFLHVCSFASYKYGDEVLDEAYGPESARHDFVLGLISWADKLANEGWPVLVSVDLDESRRVEVKIYDDNESTWEYLNRFTDGSKISEIDRESGIKPNIWLSPRLKVSRYSALQHGLAKP